GAALGRFLGLGGLVRRLGLGGRNVGATWRDTGLFVRLRLLAHCRGCGGGAFFWDQRCHSFAPLESWFRGHDMNPSGAPEMQVKTAPNCTAVGIFRWVFPLAWGAEP